MQELHAILRGKVQGVWFRAWTKDIASSIGVKGWVRNSADGSVEVIAQGDDAQVTRFREMLEQGPPLSRVTEFDTNLRPAEEIYTNFSVKY